MLPSHPRSSVSPAPSPNPSVSSPDLSDVFLLLSVSSLPLSGVYHPPSSVSRFLSSPCNVRSQHICHPEQTEPENYCFRDYIHYHISQDCRFITHSNSAFFCAISFCFSSFSFSLASLSASLANLSASFCSAFAFFFSSNSLSFLACSSLAIEIDSH